MTRAQTIHRIRARRKARKAAERWVRRLKKRLAHAFADLKLARLACR